MVLSDYKIALLLIIPQYIMGAVFRLKDFGSRISNGYSIVKKDS
jgi:hypothetical protein